MLDFSGSHRTGSVWESEDAVKFRGQTRRRVSSSSDINQQMWLKLQVTGTSAEDLNLSGTKSVQFGVRSALKRFFRNTACMGILKKTCALRH